MVLNSQQLIGLKVKTESGQFLGQVSDFEFDSLSGIITIFEVSPGHLIDKILSSNLIIGRDQVVSIGRKYMIVMDSVVFDRLVKEEPVSA